MASWQRLFAEQFGASSGNGSWKRRLANHIGATEGSAPWSQKVATYFGLTDTNGSWPRRMKFDDGDSGSWDRRNALYDLLENSPELDSLVARMSNAPSAAKQVKMAILIYNLKIAGVWSKLDVFYDFTQADTQAANLNWIANQYNITAEGAPTFVPGSHYVGDGVDDRLDTAFNPTTAVSPKFAQNDATFAFWVLTDLAMPGNVRSFIAGNTNTFLARTGATAGQATIRANRSTTNTSGSNVLFPGLAGWVRRDANTYFLIDNGPTVSGSGAAATAALSNSNFRILGTNASFGNNQVRFGFWGSQLSNTEITAIYNALLRYQA